MLELLELINSIINKYEGAAASTMIIVASLLYGMHYLVKNYSTSIKSYLQKSVDDKTKHHEEAAQHRKNIMPVIREEISQLAKEIGADRVLVFEYSNGSSNLVGLPFLYMTATNEVVTPGTASVFANYQRINTCIVAEFLERLEDKGYFYIENIEEIKNVYPMIYNFMAPNSAKTALFYSLYGIKGTIGFIVATTVHESSFKRDVGLPRIAQTAQQVSTLLNFNE
jgi:hypothetical protein